MLSPEFPKLTFVTIMLSNWANFRGMKLAIGEAAATLAAKKVVERATPAIFDRIGSRFIANYDRLKVQFTKTFEKHISKSLQKSRYVKTIVSKDKPVELEKIYVNLTLHNEDLDDIIDDNVNPTPVYPLDACRTNWHMLMHEQEPFRIA